MRETLAALTESDVTVFLSSHLLPVVDELADRVGVLADGRLLVETTPGDLKRRVDDADDRTLEDAFLELTATNEEPAVTSGG
jgi:ABC-2 type transport system ATP-binding protein